MCATDELGNRIKEIVLKHEGPLLRYALRITNNLDLAREVVQEVFLRLRQEDLSQIAGHETEWLFRVCRNRALDVWRKESRMTQPSENQLDTCTDHRPTPAQLAEQKDHSLQVMALLGKLPPNQQEVIRLKFQNGLSYHEISQITQLSISNVGFLIHTAIKTLRQQLAAAENQ